MLVRNHVRQEEIIAKTKEVVEYANTLARLSKVNLIILVVLQLSLKKKLIMKKLKNL